MVEPEDLQGVSRIPPGFLDHIRYHVGDIRALIGLSKGPGWDGVPVHELRCLDAISIVDIRGHGVGIISVLRLDSRVNNDVGIGDFSYE